MIRVVSTSDTPLIRLFRHRKWPEVLERLRTTPSEAYPTEGVLRGEKSTILALALRVGAPFEVIRALVDANRQQLVVCHRFAGSVIHEALRYLASDEVFSYIFTEAMRQQSSDQRQKQTSSTNLSPYFSSQFQCVHVQENRVVQAPNLLQVQDDLGRTVLHHVVEQIQRRRSMLGRHTRSSYNIFRRLIEAHPELVHTADSDGNTPLVLLLSQHPDTPEPELEHEIFEMVEYLTSNYPSTVAHTRRMNRPWRFLNLMNQPSAASIRSPVASPLYFAILYGRSEYTIRALLRAHEEVEDCGCAAVVTQYCEFCLHVAVTLRAPTNIIQLLVEAHPQAVHGADIFGLTPLDWLWMTYVVDWHTHGTGENNPRRLSRRRHLGREFHDWHELVTQRIPFEPDRYDLLSESMVREKQSTFLSRLRVMLLVPRDTGLLRKVCQLSNLPLGILKLVLTVDPQAQVEVSQPDTRGRYPLHYIAAHSRSYRVTVPLGVTSRVQTLTETRTSLALAEVLDRYPAACRQADDNGQLPLHVAIDGAKEDRSSAEPDCDEDYANAVLETLLEAYPESLGQRGGISNLYPWQQAAVGKGAHLDTIFQLLRKEPVFLMPTSSI